MRIEKIEPVTPRPTFGPRQANSEADTHLTISGEDRDALYNVIIRHFSDFDDLRKAYEDAKQPDLETCQRTGRKLCDGLRLIEDAGLGWGSGIGRGAAELKLPSEEELTLLFERLRTHILAEVESNQREHGEDKSRDGVGKALRACDKALRQLRTRESARGERGRSASGRSSPISGPGQAASDQPRSDRGGGRVQRACDTSRKSGR